MKDANLYSDLAKICTKFYDLSVNAKEVADFSDAKIARFKPKNILFVGGFFTVAKELIRMGYDLTVADYTDEMVEEGKRRLPGTKVVKADIRELPFKNEFDTVLVIGRVFTHMYSDDDVAKALGSIRKALKPNGILLFDNYEDTRIGETGYFNGRISVGNDNIRIDRNSSTELVSKRPFIVKWKATYTVKEGNHREEHKDEMLHRAFSRKEIRILLKRNGFEQIEVGDNFDDTSFYSVARKT